MFFTNLQNNSSLKQLFFLKDSPECPIFINKIQYFSNGSTYYNLSECLPFLVNLLNSP